MYFCCLCYRTFLDPLPPLPSECYPNGTMTALAVKVESVPNLIPSWLTLKDQSCKPVSSDDRFAYFSFSVDSCGTTRTVSLISSIEGFFFFFFLSDLMHLSVFSSLTTTCCMKMRLACIIMTETTKEQPTRLQLTLIISRETRPILS